MPWSFISDVHIKSPGDSCEEMIISFLKKSKDLKVKKIFLLGDIFDFMVGEKSEYVNCYRGFFKALANSNAEEIHFFEGNHDFHLQSVWNDFQKIYLHSPKIIYHTRGTILIKDGKKIWMSHGDDIEIGNYGYKIYKFFIRSFLVRFISRWLLPFSLIQKLGQKVAESSRRRNKYRYKIYDEEGRVKEKFRVSAAKIASQKNSDLVIIGHSHIKDIVHLDNCTYINNGYVPITRCFSFIDEVGEAKHLSL